MPDLRHTVFIDGNLRIDASPRIAVPVPNTTDVGTSLHNLTFKALLTKFVHQVDAAEASTYDQNIGFQLFCIVLVIWIGRFVRRADVCPEVNHREEGGF